jgi:HPt (histidine-containing phosphotransfer) domain-containing protein
LSGPSGAVSQSWPAGAEKDVIDPEKWSDLVENLGDSLSEVVQIYLEDLPIQVQEILDAYKIQDLETLERTAHSLKSSSGIFGIQKMVHLCNTIEVAARTKDESLKEKLAELREAYPLIAEALKNQLAR